MTNAFSQYSSSCFYHKWVATLSSLQELCWKNLPHISLKYVYLSKKIKDVYNPKSVKGGTDDFQFNLLFDVFGVEIKRQWLSTAPFSYFSSNFQNVIFTFHWPHFSIPIYVLIYLLVPWFQSIQKHFVLWCLGMQENHLCLSATYYAKNCFDGSVFIVPSFSVTVCQFDTLSRKYDNFFPFTY